MINLGGLKELQMFNDLEKQAKCNMCGKCCEAIALPVPHEYFSPNYTETRYIDKEFIWNNWTPISKEEALSINPKAIQVEYDNETETLVERELFYYTCKKFDSDTKLCSAHSERPHVCEAFPWYNNPINNVALRMHTGCSYWEDVPVEAWPEDVTWGQE